MFEIIVKDKFSAAHRIEGYTGECARMHGHNWIVELSLGVESLNKLGMALDFAECKRILSKIIEKLDHSVLNENPVLCDKNPTAETISEFIFLEVRKQVPPKISVLSVTVWESEKSGIKYYQ